MSMTMTIKLVRHISVTGRETFTIIDQDQEQVGPTYKKEVGASNAFERVKLQLQKFGNLKYTEVVNEYSLPKK